MAGLVPAIDAFDVFFALKTWMPATSAGMTSRTISNPPDICVSPFSPCGLRRAAFAREAGLPAEAPQARRLVGGDGLEPPTSCV
jgi:hypothetical protein